MGPAYGLGIVTLDGAGKGSGQFTATFGGVAQTLEFIDLRYTVSGDCGGTATYRLKEVGTNTELNSLKYELQIMDDGARLKGLMTDSGGRGAIMSCEFQRLGRGPRACHPSMLRGRYAMRYEGWINMQMLSPSQPAYFAPMVGLGLVVLDPDGANRGSATASWGGMQVATDLVTGIFNVSADCTGVYDQVIQIRGTSNKLSAKLPFVLSGDGGQLSVLMVNPPAILNMERVSIP